MEMMRIKPESLDALKAREAHSGKGGIIDYNENMEVRSLASEVRELIISIANRMDFKNRCAIFAYYGINGSPMSKDEISHELNIPIYKLDVIIDDIENIVKNHVDLDQKQK